MKNCLKILLIEDDADDVELLQVALEHNHIEHTMETLVAGDEVEAHINRSSDFPEVIVLDFNLPRMHGKEVIKLIKGSQTYKDIPLIVLTTSVVKADADFALQMGVVHFIAKPTSIMDFQDTVNKIVGAA